MEKLYKAIDAYADARARWQSSMDDSEHEALCEAALQVQVVLDQVMWGKGRWRRWMLGAV